MSHSATLTTTVRKEVADRSTLIAKYGIILGLRDCVLDHPGVLLDFSRTRGSVADQRSAGIGSHQHQCALAVEYRCSTQTNLTRCIGERVPVALPKDVASHRDEYWLR